MERAPLSSPELPRTLVLRGTNSPRSFRGAPKARTRNPETRSNRAPGFRVRRCAPSRNDRLRGPSAFAKSLFSRDRRLGRPVLEELARDHDLLHLGRALVDAQRADLAVEFLDLDTPGDAEAA